MSRLHELWWIRVLRPNSVCTGCDRQAGGLLAAVAAALAHALVDPDPLGRASRAGRACAAAASRSRSGRRGSGRVTPATAASSRCTSRELVAVAHDAIGCSVNPAVALRLGGRDHDLAHALGGQSSGPARAPTSCPRAPGRRSSRRRRCRAAEVMLTPAATAARIASDPEWWKVPSPRFWVKCARRRTGRGRPLRALAAHLRHPEHVAAAVVVSSATMCGSRCRRRRAARRRRASRCCAGSPSRSTGCAWRFQR